MVYEAGAGRRCAEEKAMELNKMRCKLCRGEMSVRKFDAIEGEDHGVHMRIEGMPAMQCEQGHKRFVAPDFAIRMMEALLADKALVPINTAAKKGLFKKRYCCADCGESLEPISGDRLVAKRHLEIPGLDPFDVQLDVPKYRCSSCGHESVEPRDVMVNDLMKASVQAFRSAEVTPA